ncbi:cellulase family glycosylhydrolase [Thermorudis peleae]|uniref:cellulase family glycosylhydrolase n=1 Tax=Thermorudis peleae TaxID=1382356 RepID=UPI0006894B90|nr:cellulase family glycosylhydrolase [Thermorudis peleae]
MGYRLRPTRGAWLLAFLWLLASCSSSTPIGTSTISPAARTSVATPSTSSSPIATTAPTATPGNTATSFAYGFNVAWRGDDQGEAFNQQTAALVQGAGFGWVRVQVEWSSLEPQPGQFDFRPIDRLVKVYTPKGIHLLISVVRPPEWARDTTGQELTSDYMAFQRLMQRLATQYRGKVQAWEIWNEQNLAYEFGQGNAVRVEPYCRLLKAGYAGVKAGDPNALVLFGGLTPTGVTDPHIAIDDVQYLEQFYSIDNGACTKYFDILGAHANATLNPPDTLWPDNPGPGPGWRDHPSFYFRRVEQLRQVMVQHGDQRPVWITEFGWTTANPAKGYEYGQYVSDEQQAQYLVRAFQIARTQWPWVTGMFVWNLNFSVLVGPNDEKGPWSVVNRDWSPRPAYRALQQMAKT